MVQRKVAARIFILAGWISVLAAVVPVFRVTDPEGNRIEPWEPNPGY